MTQCNITYAGEISANSRLHLVKKIGNYSQPDLKNAEHKCLLPILRKNLMVVAIFLLYINTTCADLKNLIDVAANFFVEHKHLWLAF